MRSRLEGIVDWFRYMMEEFRNIERNVCPWAEGELAGIPYVSNLKAKKTGSYAKRMRLA